MGKKSRKRQKKLDRALQTAKVMHDWPLKPACSCLTGEGIGGGGGSVGIQGDGGKQMVRCIQESRYPGVFRKQVFQTQLNFVLQHLFQTQLNFVPQHLFQTELNLVS